MGSCLQPETGDLRECPAGCGHVMRPCQHGCVCHACDGKGPTIIKGYACPDCGGTIALMGDNRYHCRGVPYDECSIGSVPDLSMLYKIPEAIGNA